MTAAGQNLWSRQGKPSRDTRIPCGRVTHTAQERRRIRILEAARDTFLRRGYADATIDEIAFLAGTSPATLKRDFCGKQALLRETILAAGDLCEDLDWHAHAGEALRDVLLRAAKFVSRSILGAHDRPALALVVTAQMFFPELVSAVGFAAYRRVETSITGMLQELVEEGRIPETDVTMAADQFIALVVGFPFWRSAQDAHIGGNDELLGAKIDLYLNAVLSIGGASID